MGSSSSKEDCSKCTFKLSKRICAKCERPFCKDCCTREFRKEFGKKVHVCHVCSINSEKEDDEFKIGAPQNFSQRITVRHDREKGEFIGLPDFWADLLDLTPEMSRNQIKTCDLDENIAPIMPS